MPILKVELLKAGSKQDGSFVRTSRRSFLVQATVDVNENAVREGIGFAINQVHPEDAYQFIQGIDVDMSSATRGVFSDPGNPAHAHNGAAIFVWTAAIEYGPVPPSEFSEIGDPTEEDPVISIEGINGEQIVDVDIDDNPIVNTAGDFFDPPITRDMVRCNILVTRNETGFTPATVLAYANKVNAGAWNGFPARSVKIAPPKVEPRYSQVLQSLYSRVSYVLEYNPDTWDREILNQGYRERYLDDDDEPKLRHIIIDGHPCTTPALLDADGAALRPSESGPAFTTTTFKIYEEMDFSALGMDDLFTY